MALPPAEAERIKLTANFFNSMATAFVSAGVVVPLVGVSTGLIKLASGELVGLVFGSVIWFAVGLVLHLIARSFLGGLE